MPIRRLKGKNKHHHNVIYPFIKFGNLNYFNVLITCANLLIASPMFPGGIFISIGSKVVYKSDIYTVIWVCETGFCEIKKAFNTKLVHKSELIHFPN